MLLIRGGSIAISLILVPLTINYVNSDSYGIWLTISSIVAWMSFFDIGINNGLRNRFAEAKAKGDEELARKYVSTTYFYITLIFSSIFLVFSICNYFIDWNSLLNISEIERQELSKVMFIVFGYFCLKSILSTINVILLADQRPAEASLRGFLEQGASLLIIFILTHTVTGSLLGLSVGLCIAPLLVLIFFNWELFSKRYKIYKPKYRYVDFKLSKNLFGIGIKFFVIQIAGIIQFQTANFLILRNFGGEEVTAYNIAFKYFGILTMVMGIMVTPIWSAVTEAITRKEYSWVQNMVKKYLRIVAGAALVGLLMFFVSQYAYDFWVGNENVTVPWTLSALLLIYTLLFSLGSLYVPILNGMGVVDLQFKVCLLSPLLFVGTFYLLVHHFHWGAEGIVVSMVISNINGFILAPIQYYWEMKKRKSLCKI